jgi:hypothetical protein
MPAKTGANTRRSTSASSAGSTPRDRRVGAHAAGVRALVAVVGAFVIARHAENPEVVAIAEREHRQLGATERFFDDNGAAGIPVATLDQHGTQAGLARRGIRHDVHALAGGQAIGLDDARARCDRRATGAPHRSR